MDSLQDSKAKSYGLCALLLEDDDADAYLTTRALLSMPRLDHVSRAKNGQDALKMLSSGDLKPDIAFVDLKMPTMGGLEFMAACMDMGLASVPMIVLTSSSNWKDALRSRVQGAYQIVTKPEDPAELRRLLQDLIDKALPLPGASKAYFAPGGGEVLHSTTGYDDYSSKSAASTTPSFGRRATRPGT